MTAEGHGRGTDIEELILVRPGESTGNVGAAQADADRAHEIKIGLRDAGVPLSEPGLEQARRPGRR